MINFYCYTDKKLQQQENKSFVTNKYGLSFYCYCINSLQTIVLLIKGVSREKYFSFSSIFNWFPILPFLQLGAIYLSKMHWTKIWRKKGFFIGTPFIVLWYWNIEVVCVRLGSYK